MNDTILLHHATYNAGGRHIEGEARTADEARSEMFNRADAALDREVGGFFFDTVNGTFVAGFMTPKSGRAKDYFYNMFEIPVKHAEKIKLDMLRKNLEKRKVSSPNKAFNPKTELEINDNAFDSPDAYAYDMRTVATLWDQCRQDGMAVASVSEVSYFKSVVKDSLPNISFVNATEESVKKYGDGYPFDIKSGEMPDGESKRIEELVRILSQIQEENGVVQYQDLPSLEEQYRSVFDVKLDQSLEELREQTDIDPTEQAKAAWMDLFTSEIEPVFEKNIQRFMELQKIRLDPKMSLKEEIETEDGRLAGYNPRNLITFGKDSDDPMRRALEDLKEKQVRELRTELEEKLESLEQNFQDQIDRLVEESEKHAVEVRQKEMYQRYQATVTESDGDNSS